MGLLTGDCHSNRHLKQPCVFFVTVRNCPHYNWSTLVSILWKWVALMTYPLAGYCSSCRVSARWVCEHKSCTKGQKWSKSLWCQPLCYFEIVLRHTTLDRTPLDHGLARHREAYLTTHNAYKKQTSMSPAGFRSTIQETSSHRPKS
jgi:hypothetical protein